MKTNIIRSAAVAALAATIGLGLINTKHAAADTTDAVPAQASADPQGVGDYLKLGLPRWKVHASGKQIRSGQKIKLSNTMRGTFLAWKNQRFGVDLGSYKSHKPTTKLMAKKGGVIRYGEPIAIWVADKPGRNNPKRFIYYKKARFGINIGWHKQAKYDWYIAGGKKGTPVKPGAEIILRNKTAEAKHNRKKGKLRGDLVYCARNKGGAWLKWAHTCSKADLVRTRIGK